MIAYKAALTALVFSLLVAGAATAQGGHGREGGRGGGNHGGGREAAYAPRPEPRGYNGGRGGYPGGAPAYPDGHYAPRGYARPENAYTSYPPPLAAPSGNWRRGQFLPPGGQALDPRRSRLRSPPPGYEWRGVGRDSYLVQRSTGLILDTAPGGR